MTATRIAPDVHNDAARRASRMLFALGALLGVRAAWPGRVFAALENPIAEDTLYCFLVSILEAFVMVVFPFVVLALIYSGYLFVKAQGNSNELTKARTYFMWCAVGALVVLGAQALAFAIEGTVTNIYQEAGLGGQLTSGRGACD